MNAATQHLLAALALGLVACASQPDAPVAADDDGEPDYVATQVVDPRVVCRMEKSTGTNIAQKRCYTREELAEMSRNSREFMRTGGTRGAVYTPTDEGDPRKKRSK